LEKVVEGRREGRRKKRRERKEPSLRVEKEE
jgi:hypothetical protein